MGGYVDGSQCNDEGNEARGLTPLFFSIFNDSYESFRILLEAGSDPNRESSSSECDGFVTPLHVAVAEGNVKCVGDLLERGADPNKMSSFGNETPLYISAYMNDFECLQLLLKYKADPDILKQGTKLSAIDIAVKGSDCHELLVEEKNKRKLMKCKEYLDEKCPICLDEMTDGGEIEITNCYHGFHKECWEEYGSKEICPICRGKAI